MLAVLVPLTAAVRLTPWWRPTLGPLVAVATIGTAVVATDLLTGASLQLNGIAGYSALEGGRYAGLGTVALGVFIAGLLLGAGCLAQLVARRWRPAFVAVLGGFGVVLVGSPYLGADAGGAIALTAGTCISAALATGGWLTFARLVWATLAGLVVTAGFALIDLRRPADDRGRLGRFLTDLNDGSGGLSISRAGSANVLAFVSSPLTILAIGSAAFVLFALLRPWGGLKRLFGLYPAVRGAMAGLTVASVIAGLLDSAALNVTGAAVATAVPLATVAALRVLDHADERTPAPGWSPGGTHGPDKTADEPKRAARASASPAFDVLP
jgi:hypothetical protein